MFWNKILRTDETKINLYQTDVKEKSMVKGAAQDPKHTTSRVKHSDYHGSVMARACMAANGTGLLVFIDDVTADRSSKKSLRLHFLLIFSQMLQNR